jgi:hypothetical protein
MSITITDKSRQAFENAAKKLGTSTQLPDYNMMRKDHALYMTAVYMLIVIIEAGKDGKLHDITNHSVYKYETIHRAVNGYKPGSSGGGFSYIFYVLGHVGSFVGARLSFNSWEEGKKNAEDYPDLWEIVKLNVW